MTDIPPPPPPSGPPSAPPPDPAAFGSPPHAAPPTPPVAGSVVMDTMVQPPKKSKNRIIVAVAGGVLALGAAGFLATVLLKDSSSGSKSPEEAVQGLADAIDGDDPLAALTFMAPDEMNGMTEFVSSVGSLLGRADMGQLKSDETDSTFDVDMAIDDIEVDELGDSAARVTVNLSGGIGAIGDDTMLGGLLADRSGEFEDIDLELITVKVDGGWYVSPMLTAGDAIYNAVDAAGDISVSKPDYDMVGESSDGDADSPEAAVEAFAEAINDRDPEAMAGVLRGGEARLMRVYGDMIDDLLAEIDDQAVTVEIDDLATEDLGDGRVAIDAMTFTAADGSSSGTAEFDEDCVTITNTDEDGATDEGSERCLLANAPFEPPLDDNRIVIVTAKEDGKYVVDPIETVLSLGTQLADRITRPQILSALGLQVLDEPTPLEFGETVDGEFDEKGYAVFEVAVPADSEVTLTASTGDEDLYLDAQPWLLESDDQWYTTYGNPISTDDSTTMRVVVSASCAESDEDALLFTCLPATEGAFTVAVKSVTTEAVTVPGTITGELASRESAFYTFSVDADTLIDITSVDGVNFTLEGPWSYPDSGTGYALSAGDYRLIVTNYSSTDKPFTAEIVDATPVLGGDLSADQPQVTVDLSSGTATIDLVLEDGDVVDVTASPNDGQDVVLTISGTECQALDASFVDEVCSFTVGTGGIFTVEVSGFDASFAYGTVDITLTMY